MASDHIGQQIQRAPHNAWVKRTVIREDGFLYVLQLMQQGGQKADWICIWFCVDIIIVVFFFFSEQLKRMACFSLDVIQIRSILRDANGRERIFSCIPIIKMASWVSTYDFISWRHLLILTLQWCFELHVTGQSYFLSLKLQTQNSHIENFVRKIHIEQAMGMKWLCIPTVITVVVIIECL